METSECKVNNMLEHPEYIGVLIKVKIANCDRLKIYHRTISREILND
jgi:hypothetical protein